ncbi:MAG: DUF3526 domain-containing protein [Balneolaceae bacterium]|nr:DUF3526 domain-containing protein [Balneolaceae bacterium]
MYTLLVQKELKNILLSSKFTATFIVCSILIILSVFIGIQEYNNAVSQYDINQQIASQNIEEANGWDRVRNIAHRKPNPLQIFVSGLHFDVGRLSNISSRDDVKLSRSPYSDETIFAIFRFIDLAFIVQVVLSLFAILFTYNAINGERENGTLKLAFSNSVSRAKYLLAKFSGIWLGLIIPLLIPLLVTLLLLMVYKVPLSGADWNTIAAFFGLSMLYVTFFIGLGLLISALTQKSSLSFLLLLVIWIGSVLILPRIGVMTAGQLVPVRSVAQIEALQQAYEQQQWDEYSESLSNSWKQRMQEMEGMTEEERQAYRDEHEWNWMEEDDALRRQVRENITKNNRLLLEETQNRKNHQQQLAFNVSRISPASSFRLAAMNLATTDITLKSRYEESMRTYRDIFTEYVEQKKEETDTQGGFQISIDSDEGVSIDFGRDDQKLDVSGVPQYTAPDVSVAAAFGRSIIDFGLLSIFIVICFGGTFVAFIRYDMR